MALHVLPQIATNTTKAFLDYLVSKNLIKSGFSQILGNKYLDEVDDYLLEHQLVGEIELAQAYSDFFNLPFIRLVNRPIRPNIVRMLPESVSHRYTALVYDLQGLNLHVAVGEPSRLQRNAPDVLVRLRRQKGLRVHLSIAPRQDILAAIDKIYHLPRPQEEAKTPLTEGHKSKDHESTRGTSHVQKKPETKPESVESKQPQEKESEVKQKGTLIKEVENRAKTVDLRSMEIEPETINKIPKNVAKKFQIIVFGEEKSKSKFEPSLIKVAAVDPDDIKVREILGYIEQRNKLLVERYKIDVASFDAAIKLYPESGDEKVEIVSESMSKDQEGTASVKSEAQTAKAEPHTPKPEQGEKDDQDSLAQAAASHKTEASKSTIRTSVDEPSSVTLSSSDIINRPSSEESSTEELQRLAKEQEISLEDQNLDRLLKGPVNSAEDLAAVFKDGRVPEIVAATLFLGIRMKASDVHIEAAQDTVRLRFRIDGILHDVIRVPHFLHAPLISRIKILSKMKIDEQRVPQDGRFDVIIDKRQVDLRVSTLPTVHGEKVVMRLLDKSEGVLTLEQLGVTGTNFDRLVENIGKPYGVILSTGPTGSGKSTTLYAVLNRISKPGVNIITLEDPVEYELGGINQAQVKPGIGFTFAEGLRSVLRQDPNVIMVGEIRDLETAAMSTHAALTGHLVLSTLHTNDAAGALPRLINMGVEPFLITSSMNAVIGQRLVRKVCDQCKQKAVIPPAVLSFIKRQMEALPSSKNKEITPDQLVFYRGVGCSNCTDGYKGRIGIYEVLTMNDEIEGLAVSKAPASDIKKAAIKAGMITMTQDGLIKALKGITTIDEVLRVTTTQIKELPV